MVKGPMAKLIDGVVDFRQGSNAIRLKALQDQAIIP